MHARAQPKAQPWTWRRHPRETSTRLGPAPIHPSQILARASSSSEPRETDRGVMTVDTKQGLGARLRLS